MLQRSPCPTVPPYYKHYPANAPLGGNVSTTGSITSTGSKGAGGTIMLSAPQLQPPQRTSSDCQDNSVSSSPSKTSGIIYDGENMVRHQIDSISSQRSVNSSDSYSYGSDTNTDSMATMGALIKQKKENEVLLKLVHESNVAQRELQSMVSSLEKQNVQLLQKLKEDEDTIITNQNIYKLQLKERGILLRELSLEVNSLRNAISKEKSIARRSKPVNSGAVKAEAGGMEQEESDSTDVSNVAPYVSTQYTAPLVSYILLIYIDRYLLRSMLCICMVYVWYMYGNVLRSMLCICIVYVWYMYSICMVMCYAQCYVYE